MSAQTSHTNETQLMPGMMLDRYELLAPVATGGFGSVWLGRLKGKRGFEKLVAIKVPKLNGDVSFSEMLLDEARIASAIDHDNVCKILELGEQGDILYIVMEWIDGEPVSTLLRALDKTKTPFPLPIALRIISDMCLATHAAHELKGPSGEELGVVHRDVSPQNMLISGTGSVKLIDFGIAKAKDRASGDTTEGTLKGKVKYMAPEQALGRAVDRRTDVFALGAVLYRFLCGHAPFEAENEVATIHKLASATPAPPVPDRFPSSIRSIVARALSPVASARFRTALEMHQAIDAAGITGDRSEVTEFVNAHLADRLSKRRAAIEIALKAAADRGADVRTNIADLFPPPLSSRDGSNGLLSGSSSGSQSVGAIPTVIESSGVVSQSQITGPQLPAELPPRKLGWLWALAMGVGAVGVVMIVLVATRKPPATPVAAASAAVSANMVAMPIITAPTIEPAPPPTTSSTPAVSASSAPSAKPVAVGHPVWYPPKSKGKPASSAKPGAADFGY
jgi:serine/threonine-protein kinase